MKHRNSGVGENNALQNQFTKYVMTAIHRKKIDYLRSMGKKRPVENLSEYLYQLEDIDNLDLYLPLLEQLENAALYYALKRISRRNLQIVVMRAVEGYSFQEIAAVLNMKYNATANAYYRTIQLLRQYLEEGKK